MMTEEERIKLYQQVFESGKLDESGNMSTVLGPDGKPLDLYKSVENGKTVYTYLGDPETTLEQDDEFLKGMVATNLKPPADPSQVLLDDLIPKQKKDVKTDIAILGTGEALKLGTVLGGLLLDPTLKAQRKQAKEGIDQKQLALDARRDVEKVTQAAGATGRQVEQALEGAVAADQGTKSLKELQTIQRSVGETVAQQRKAGMEFVVQQDAIRRAQALAEQKDVEAAAVAQRAAMLKATTDALGSVQKGLAGVLGSKGAKTSDQMLKGIMLANPDLSSDEVLALNSRLQLLGTTKKLTPELINRQAGLDADDDFGMSVFLNIQRQGK